MKIRLASLVFVSLLFLSLGGAISCESPTDNRTSSGDCVWVDPYHRSDGTCVRGHWKSKAGGDCDKVGTEYENCS